jgi:hypothetical protein
MLTCDTLTAPTPVSDDEQLQEVSPNVTSETSSTGHCAKLGWILINKRWISPAQLELNLTSQLFNPRRLGELLVEQRLISAEQLEEALREQHWRRNGYWVI